MFVYQSDEYENFKMRSIKEMSAWTLYWPGQYRVIAKALTPADESELEHCWVVTVPIITKSVRTIEHTPVILGFVYFASAHCSCLLQLQLEGEMRKKNGRAAGLEFPIRMSYK